MTQVGTTPRDPPLEWESLVTEGHVRAARVRRVQPWLIAAAVAAILLSFYLAAAVRHSTNGFSAGTAAPANDDAARVRAAIFGLPPLQVRPSEGATLAPFQQLGTIVVPQLLEGLERNDQLGTSTIKVTTLSADRFWREEWPHTGLIGLGSGDVRLVGAVANQGSVSYATPARWLGVFSKRHGQWKFMSAADSGFAPVYSKPSAFLEQIPLTLKPVLPAKE